MAEAVGGGYAEVDTKEFKASQYNHVTGNYEKISLSQREKQIGGRIIQRDLYSAFLIHNADPELKHPDIEKCKYEFGAFFREKIRIFLFRFINITSVIRWVKVSHSSVCANLIIYYQPV